MWWPSGTAANPDPEEIPLTVAPTELQLARRHRRGPTFAIVKAPAFSAMGV
jgi:hypothetical protein